jgi:hypothetical protein
MSKRNTGSRFVKSEPQVHWAWWDDLQQHYTRRASCGKWVHHGDVAADPELITCDDCKAELQRLDNLAKSDDEDATPF